MFGRDTSKHTQVLKGWVVPNLTQLIIIWVTNYNIDEAYICQLSHGGQ